jgi:hypothetical protein
MRLRRCGFPPHAWRLQHCLLFENALVLTLDRSVTSMLMLSRSLRTGTSQRYLLAGFRVREWVLKMDPA